MPPTLTSEDEILDGRKRAQRRRQLSSTRKVPFHQREAITSSDGTSSKGHTLYHKHAVVNNWGELPGGPSDQKDANDTSAEA